jgi:NitT/TauT family transport system substrate-binding protein
LFEKHGLNVELVNFGGSTDQLLEAISTGKSDAGVGMALRWLKPLEQGFDVKIVAGLHGGCLRLIGSKAANVAKIEDLKGKTVGITDMASPAKNFFSILLLKAGIDPIRDVQWRTYPGDLLGVAVDKGEIQALADGDPLTWAYARQPGLQEVATNLSGEYHTRTCCLLGVGDKLLKDNQPAAKALTAALLEAQHLAAHDPQTAAEAFVPYAPKYPVADLTAMLGSHAHHLSPQGAELRQQLALYADELKLVSVIKASTDTAKFAERITFDLNA